LAPAAPCSLLPAPRCFIIGTPLKRAAIDEHFKALGDELARRGHRAVIACPPTECAMQMQNGGAKVVLWPSKRPTQLADAVFLWRLIRQHQPDCLISHFASVNWMCFVGWLKKVPCRIAWYHTLSSQTEMDRHSPWLKQRWLGFRKSLVYRTATLLACNSQAAAADAQRAFGVPDQKCRVWRNGLADPARWLELRHSEQREDLIVCTGRFDLTKGQDVLIEALGLSAKNLISTKVEFLGAGPRQQAVQQRARQIGLDGRCTFTGTVAHEEVLRRMSRAKLTVVPSRSEAFGLVNIESMAVGTPVIASAVGGIPDIVRDGVDGFLVPPDNPKALAEKLELLLHDSDLRGRLGQNARQRFLETYEQSKVVGEQADWLEEMVGQQDNR
jgi:glycosyltransferase involved in cell wall biosynthesis